MDDLEERAADYAEQVGGLEWEITYANAKNDDSERRITVRDVYTRGGHLYLKAVCHEVSAVRAFRTDRILEATDLETGEIYEDEEVDAVFFALGRQIDPDLLPPKEGKAPARKKESIRYADDMTESLAAPPDAGKQVVKKRGVSFWGISSITLGVLMLMGSCSIILDAEGESAIGLTNLILAAALIAIPLYLSRLPAASEAGSGGFRNAFEQWQYDVTRPEKERRAEMVAALTRTGWLIDRQEKGLVTARKPKTGFSILLFFILMLLFVLPALCYLIWYIFQRDRVVQYALVS